MLRIEDFTCSNCGRIMLQNVKIDESTKIRDPRFYCSACYYAVIQKNKQLRIRLETLQKLEPR